MSLVTVADRAAEAGQFRIVGVYTVDPDSWIAGDYPTLEDATKAADKLAARHTQAQVYDDQGQLMYKAGPT